MGDQQPITISERDQQRAQHRIALEFGSREEFEDPRFGYRRLFAEALGTFLLVLAAAGGGVLHAKGQISEPTDLSVGCVTGLGGVGRAHRVTEHREGDHGVG